MSKALETAPAMPAGSVDFNKFNALCAKGDAKAAEKAVIEADAPSPATTSSAAAAD